MTPAARHLILVGVVAFAGLPSRGMAGYTHYWTWKQAPPPDALAACVEDMRRVIEARRSLLTVYEGDEAAGQPIAINGVGEDEYEPFLFPWSTSAALRAGTSSGHQDVRRAVWMRDEGCCAVRGPDGRRCGSHWKLELDHILPLAQGGPSTVDNFRLAAGLPPPQRAPCGTLLRRGIHAQRRGACTSAGRSPSPLPSRHPIKEAPHLCKVTWRRTPT